jgi:hypothetical protein
LPWNGICPNKTLLDISPRARVVFYITYGRLIENYLNKMSEVYKIYHFNWDQEDEMVYVEAEVADAIMSCSATLYEPEQWTHGKCTTSFLWPDDGEALPNEQNIFEYINNNPVIKWELIPLSNFLELTEV